MNLHLEQVGKNAQLNRAAPRRIRLDPRGIIERALAQDDCRVLSLMLENVEGNFLA